MSNSININVNETYEGQPISGVNRPGSPPTFSFPAPLPVSAPPPPPPSSAPLPAAPAPAPVATKPKKRRHHKKQSKPKPPAQRPVIIDHRSKPGNAEEYERLIEDYGDEIGLNKSDNSSSRSVAPHPRSRSKAPSKSRAVQKPKKTHAKAKERKQHHKKKKAETTKTKEGEASRPKPVTDRAPPPSVPSPVKTSPEPKSHYSKLDYEKLLKKYPPIPRRSSGRRGAKTKEKAVPSLPPPQRPPPAKAKKVRFSPHTLPNRALPSNKKMPIPPPPGKLSPPPPGARKLPRPPPGTPRRPPSGMKQLPPAVIAQRIESANRAQFVRSVMVLVVLNAIMLGLVAYQRNRKST